MTSPDLSCLVNKLSQFLSAPTINHWTACKKALSYLKGTLNYGLIFKPAPYLVLEGFSDADWANNLYDRRSTTGQCIYLGGNLLNWCSRKQKVVSKSS